MCKANWSFSAERSIIWLKCILWFNSYEHFYYLNMDGRTDSYRDYSAHLWGVQYCLDFKRMLFRHGGGYIIEQSVLVRAYPK